MKNFDTKTLLDTASERTGLTDLGEPDCLNALEALVESVNETGEVAADRWDAVFEYMVRVLVNRLWFAKDLAEHPEIADQDLLPPVAIVGLPRTGSTKLQRMLGESNSFQNLLWWQMHMFARIPGQENGGIEQRFRVTKDFEEWNYEVCPDMAKGHPRYADAPEEEQILQEFTFPPVLAVYFSGADYSQERLMQFDPAPMYRYMALQLKYLQWQFYRQDPRPWVLKSPTNLGFEENLIESFGRKTKLIVPHRDPVNIVSSIAKTAEYYRKVYSDVSNEQKKRSLGANMLNALLYGVQRQMEWRQQNPDIEILDVSFKDIVGNPLHVMRSVYEFLNIELTEEIEARVLSWDEDQKNTHQKNEYSLEEFGLTESQVNSAFEPYLEQYSNYIN